MRLIALLLCLFAGPALAQDDPRVLVQASAPSHHALTIYRDPDREEGDRMDRGRPRGLAMITETRTVTLPAGRSTLAFEGVAEGMVAVTAIVTGLPQGTIERNRNADLLSPAALVNGMLGNRVRIARTRPGTGVIEQEEAIVRTRADGGLVLETSTGFEAVRCSGLPERLVFDRVPANLSIDPVFTVDTFDPTGGTYEIQLTYLAWGFDWEANYVAVLGEGRADGSLDLNLMAWLSLQNDNGQTFPDADLLAVAGTIEVESDFEELADLPYAAPLRLTCYPLGSTARGSPLAPPPPPPPPPMAVSALGDDELIVVTGSRVTTQTFDAANALAVLSEEAMAKEEQLGDLKLYRVPRPVTVAAQSLKQVAFLSQPAVKARFVYRADCDLSDPFDDDFSFVEDAELFETDILLATRNVEDMGLGVALPLGEILAYERTSRGLQLASVLSLEDTAKRQDIELDLGTSAQVLAYCAYLGTREPDDRGRRFTDMRLVASNPNGQPVTFRLIIGRAGDWDVRFPGERPMVKDGLTVVETILPASSQRSFTWQIRPSRVRRKSL